MSSSSNNISGQCLCEAVGYEVVNDFKYALNCHCSKCRRATGAAFKSFGGIESSKLKIVKG
ncbi:MAG: GFA family protein, partial [Pseudobdellovibrio sp.]